MGTHVTTFDVKLVLSTSIVICLSILFNEVIMLRTLYIYAQRLGFAQALQRRGFPFPNKC